MKKYIFIFVFIIQLALSFAVDVVLSSYDTSDIKVLIKSPYNNFISFIYEDYIKVYDSKDFSIMNYFETSSKPFNGVWSEDEKYFFSGNYNGTIDVFNRESSILNFQINEASDNIISIKSYGNFIAFSSMDRGFYVYNYQKRRLVYKKIMENSIHSISFLNSDEISIGDSEGNIFFININDGHNQNKKVSNSLIRDIFKVNDEIIVFSVDGRISIFDMNFIHRNTIYLQNSISKVIFSPNNNYFSVLFSNNDLKVYSFDTMFSTLNLKNLDYKIKAIEWSYDWKFIYISDGENIYIVDITTGILKKVFENFASEPSGVLWIDDKIVYMDQRSNLAIINSSTARIEKFFKTPILFTSFDITYDFKLIGVDREGFLYVYDLDNGSIINKLKVSDSNLNVVKVSKDNSYIAVGGWDSNLYIYSYPDMKLFKKIDKLHSNWIKDIDFNKDSNIMAVSGLDKKVSLIQYPFDKNNVRYLNDFKYNIWSVEWSNSSNLLALGGFDGIMEIWDPYFSNIISRTGISTGAINILDWSKDGALISSGSEDGSIYLWNSKDSSLNSILTANNESIFDVSFDSGGRYLVSISNENIIRIWDVQEKKNVANIMIFSDGKYVSFKDNGDYITNISEEFEKKYFLKYNPISLFESLNFKKIDSLSLKEKEPPVINVVDELSYTVNNSYIMINVIDNGIVKNIRILDENIPVNNKVFNINYKINLERLYGKNLLIEAYDDSGNYSAKNVSLNFKDIKLQVISNQAVIRNEEGKIISVLSRGIVVDLIDLDKDRYFIEYRGKRGYVNKAFMMKINPEN